MDPMRAGGPGSAGGPGPDGVGDRHLPAPSWLGAPYPDYLGENWRASRIYLRDDDGGAPRHQTEYAALVHETDAAQVVAKSGMAALWIPGFVDSFFHVEHARAWRQAGVALVGLDMRRAGRALLGRHRDDIRDLHIRDEEIGRAVAVLRSWGARSVVLIGHSTGGLQVPLFVARNPDAVDAIILNSPWFDHNGSELEKHQLTTLVDRVGGRLPTLPIASLKPHYARSLHADFGGEFHFDTAHKPVDNVPVLAGFFRAVRRGQAELAAGLDLEVPVLVAHSSASGSFRKPSAAELAQTDVVLNVDDMVRLAPRLGRNVDMLTVPGGRHDLALSQASAREFYTERSISWALDMTSTDTRY
ncbi:alpha/beta hydrolase [Trueperella pecoris]|nr:alpha/beta fold hydrolase [Trueperella pecoris]